MTIQDWGAVGEVLGALLVAVTLIYLTMQVTLSRRFALAVAQRDVRLELGQSPGVTGGVPAWLDGLRPTVER